MGRAEPFKSEIRIVDNWNNNSDDEVTIYLKSMGIKGKAASIGNVQYETTKEWQRLGGARKSFGKSDIIIGDYHISLKSKDDHLIFSGGKGESKATFLSVANKFYKKELSAMVDKIINNLDSMVTGGLTSDTITKSKKTDYLLQQAMVVHKEIKKDIMDLFDKDKNFSMLVVHEMLSGELKFGKDSPGSAEYILYPDPKLISIDSPKIFENNKMSVHVDFKSANAPASGSTSNYRWWGVVQMIQRRIRLNESFEIVQDIKKYLNSLFNIIRSYLIDDWSEVLGFMELEISD